MDFSNIRNKVLQFHKILENTDQYRQDWTNHLRQMIIDHLQMVIDQTQLRAKIVIKDELYQMEAIALSLGHSESGISEKVGDAKRHLIKNGGMLVYQQLFNGKVMITIMYPYIDGIGQPKSPKLIEIMRPYELKPPFILRHVEDFLREVIEWEDFDDDMPQPIGFQTSFERKKDKQTT